MQLQTITSTHNPHVKDAARLRERRQREKQGRILIEGAREVARAAAGGVEFIEAFVCEALATSPDARTAVDRLVTCGTRLLAVTPQVFAKLAFGDRAEGIIAVARTPRHALADLRLPEPPLVAVVEDIEKPGNLGAIMRTADAAGVSAVIAVGQGTDLYNPNVIRASLGTVFTLPVCAAKTDETLRFLRQRPFKIYAAQVDATALYAEVDFRGPAAIVLGSETTGLSSIWQAGDVIPVRLPMRGAADSLNVSAAAAALFYEALRQRL